MFKVYQKNKFEYLLLIISILISLVWSVYNLKNFDKIKINFEGRFYNQLLYEDLESNWRSAETFRKKIEDGENFFRAIPAYEKYFLPVITIGTYYFLIDQEILENKEIDKTVIKTGNFKLGFLTIQILFYYFSIILFANQIKKKISVNLYKIILIFLCLEPSILQWHSSFWTESIFLSLMLLLFSFILRNSGSFLTNIVIGVLVGLMFAQRAVSFLYIIPVIIYYIFVFGKNLKPYIFLLVGYSFIVLLIGYKNFNETKHFHVLSKLHQYVSYYHYFAPSIYADRLNISSKEAQKILSENENKWMDENNIDLNNFEDLEKNIEYRNQIFFDEVLKNPFYFISKFSKRIIMTSVIHPLWVHENHFIDKTDPQAKNDPKKYYHKNIFKDIIYSIFIYIFTIIGIFKFFSKIYKKKKINDFEKFIIFNIFSALYFLSISGLWGNPKYFAPCMISVTFFFAIGLKNILFKPQKKFK